MTAALTVLAFLTPLWFFPNPLPPSIVYNSGNGEEPQVPTAPVFPSAAPVTPFAQVS